MYETPTFVVAVDGDVLCGSAARQVAGCVGPVDVMRHIDDESVECGLDSEVDTVTLLAAFLSESVRAAGIDPSEVVVLCPPHWGATRRGVLRAAGTEIAADVTVVSSAEVAVRVDSAAVTSAPTDESVVVIDRTEGRVTVTDLLVAGRTVTPMTCRLLDPVIAGVDRDPGALLDRIASSIGESEPTMLPRRVVMHGPEETVSTTGVRQVVDMPVTVVTDEELVSIASSTPADRPAPEVEDHGWAPAPANLGGEPVRSAAWLGRMNLEAAPRRRRVGRGAGVAVGAVFVAAVAIGAALVAFGPTIPSTAPPRAQEAVVADEDEVTGTDTEIEPGPEAEVGQRFSVGTLSLTVPPQWHVEPGEERVLLRPDDGSRMRVVLVSRELGAGVTTPDVIDTVRSRVDGEQSERFSDLRIGNIVAGHESMSYVERPVDGSTVHWSVLVTDRLQTSVGCQSAVEMADRMTELCAAVLATVEFG